VAPGRIFKARGTHPSSTSVQRAAFRNSAPHRRQPTLEMAASMIIPDAHRDSPPLAAGVLSFGALMGLEHVAMLLGMLVAMLLRIDEYSSHAHDAA
jgi:hypothetical protein